MKIPSLFCLLGLLVHTGFARSGDAVSVESLLLEMVDRDAVARFPESNFRLKQQSSYDRKSVTPDDPKGWFANKDFNWNDQDHNFVRIEENGGRKEWVLMEHEGPGALVRSWMPFKEVPEGQVLRIYLDGATQPAIEGNACTLFNGDGLIPYPFAHKSLRSAVSFFPIPYGKGCKITLSERPFFFIFTYREYPEGTPVRSFSLDDFKRAQKKCFEVGKKLADPQAGENLNRESLTRELKPGGEVELELPAGSAAVRELTVKLGNYDDPGITRKLVLRIEFDGRQTVWCPVGDFFGSGIGLNPFQGWYRTVADDGTMSCRWVMPYRKSGAVSLVNLSDEPVGVELEAATGGWRWDDRSMVFNAAWRGQYPVPTRPYSDWNYVTLKGRGVYVGDTLTVMNPIPRWWGEGDAKIWIDGEDFPSIFGTGTEDYYAYSWGGISTDFYEHPFHAQPRAHVYNKLNRNKGTQHNTLGYSVETRTRSLDTMPFGSSLQLDMEVWAWEECDMAYGVGTYWYGFADTTSNRKPDPEEAVAVPQVPKKKAPAKKEPIGRIPFAVEIEKQHVTICPGHIQLRPQNLKQFRLKGLWNEDDHILFKGAKVGDVVEIRIPTDSTVPQKLALHGTRSYDFGIIDIEVNGKLKAGNMDLFSPKPVPSERIELGVSEPVNGAYLLRINVTGKSPQSRGAFFALDCITLDMAD